MRAVIHPPTPFSPNGHTVTTLLLPAHWGSALINGDYTDTIDDREACIIDQIELLFGRCVDASSDVHFAHTHDVTAEGVLPCDVCEFQFISHNPDL